MESYLFLRDTKKLSGGKSEKENDYPYMLMDSLLTPAEYSFYRVVDSVLPNGYVLTCKVRIGDVLRVRSGIDKKTSLFNA